MASSGNFATLNPLKYKASSYTTSSIVKGNRQLGSKTGNAAQLNFGFKNGDGKYYFEAYGTTIPSSFHYGVCIGNADLNNVTAGKAIIGYRDSGNKVVSTAPQTNSTQSSYGASYTGGDVMGCAVDFTNGTIEFYKNNTSQGSIDWSSANDGSTYYPYVYQNTGVATINTGQDSTFCGQLTAQNNSDENGFGDFYYSPPSGFLAMCSANLPISSDIDPNLTDDNYPSKQFFISQYAGNLTARTITTEAQPDLIIIRTYDNAQDWYVLDSNRGITANKYLITNSTSAEATFPQSNFTSIGATSVGISAGTWLNSTGANYQMWLWKCNGGTTSSNTQGSITATVQANTNAGFSIVTYTGGYGSWGSSYRSTFGHGLSQAPEFMIFKERNNTDAWTVFHHSVGNGGGSNPASNNLRLDTNDALYTNQSYKSFGGVMPTSTLVTVEGNTTNSSSSTHVAYIWHSVEGYSKFGSYEGNGNSDGPFVYTGFRPRLLFIKNIDTGNRYWTVIDSARSTFNLADDIINFDQNIAQYSSSARGVDILSNGFKIRGNDSDNNTSGDTYVFGAWSDGSFKYQSNTF